MKSEAKFWSNATTGIGIVTPTRLHHLHKCKFSHFAYHNICTSFEWCVFPIRLTKIFFVCCFCAVLCVGRLFPFRISCGHFVFVHFPTVRAGGAFVGQAVNYDFSMDLFSIRSDTTSTFSTSWWKFHRNREKFNLTYRSFN